MSVITQQSFKGCPAECMKSCLNNTPQNIESSAVEKTNHRGPPKSLTGESLQAMP
jgi:hypothetical protein